MKRFFVNSVGFLISFLPLPQRVKDFLVWPVATRVLGINFEMTVKMKDGFLMNGSMGDILSRKVLFEGRWKKNIWEPKTSDIIDRLSEKSPCILVAGSHIGYMVLKAALSTKGEVHTFEPVPKLFETSIKNFRINKNLVNKIKINQSALGEKSGSIEFYTEDIRSSAVPYSSGHLVEGKKITVPVTTVDEYSLKNNINFDLILLDVEGFEWFVLNGATNTLSRKPDLILEISPKILSKMEVSSDMILTRLHSMGYKTKYLDKDKDYANIYATLG